MEKYVLTKLRLVELAVLIAKTACYRHPSEQNCDEWHMFTCKPTLESMKLAIIVLLIKLKHAVIHGKAMNE